METLEYQRVKYLQSTQLKPDCTQGFPYAYAVVSTGHKAQDGLLLPKC